MNNRINLGKVFEAEIQGRRVKLQLVKAEPIKESADVAYESGIPHSVTVPDELILTCRVLSNITHIDNRNDNNYN